MNVEQISRVYFAGIGGIGMSALARFFRNRGAQVAGYDKTETPLTRSLQQEGMQIHYTDDPALLDKETQLVVYTPALPPDHKELSWYREQGYPVYKRSDVLQWITEAFFAITVAGTHGKTTISTMTAFLLRDTGIGCNAFLGGLSVNYNINYWSSDNPVAVIEADEYDRSFLKLHPDIAVLTAMDADLLDIYGTVEELEAAFIQYTKDITQGGTLIYKHGLPRTADLAGSRKISYSLQNDAADAFAANITQRDGGYVFDLISPFGNISQIRLNIGGMHNVENAIVALLIAQMQDVPSHEIKDALANFAGVKRRFEYLVKNERVVYIDDYAHHPEELASLIKSAKRLFPKRKCVVAFQPHLYSRTRDLADGFAQSLDLADQVILLDIYPARELPIEGVTSEMITTRMENKAHTILSKEGLLELVRSAPLELLITAGAGDIDKLTEPIKEILEKK